MHIIGIDPGLVDTGVVRMSLYLGPRVVEVAPLVIKDLRNVDNLNEMAARVRVVPARDSTYVEKYVPRPGMGTNEKMVELEHMIKDVLPRAQLVRNTGAKQVVTRELMELLGVWKFPQSTHHQDLRSAARIGLFGALKFADSNSMISQIVRDHLAGATWSIDLRAGETVGP